MNVGGDVKVLSIAFLRHEPKNIYLIVAETDRSCGKTDVGAVFSQCRGFNLLRCNVVCVVLKQMTSPKVC